MNQETTKKETLTYSESSKKEERLFNSTMMLKQETLEEAAERFVNTTRLKNAKSLFIEGAKWQEKRNYSEDEVMDILYKHTEDLFAGKRLMLDEWFNQFKKK